MRAALPLIVAALLAVGGWYQAARLEQRLTVLESRQPVDPSADAGPTPDDRLSTMESALKSMSESFFNQATDVAELKQERERLRKARIDLDDKTFSRVETPLGPLFVQAEGIRRKAEDTTVDLLIGNPSAASLVNASLRARWGRSYEPSGDFQLWQDGLKEREFPIKDTLRPGSWSRYTLHLDTGPVTQVGFLEIAIDAKTVLLQDVATTTTAPRPTTTSLPRKPVADIVGEDRPEPDLDSASKKPTPARPPTKPATVSTTTKPKPASPPRPAPTRPLP